MRIRESILLLVLAGLPACKDAANEVQRNEQTECVDTPVIHTGEATFYRWANGGGACLFDTSSTDLLIGAMNAVDYDNALACGTCVRVSGPDGEIAIRIVDLCPECNQGDIDLSPFAFSLLADTNRGRVPITWQVIPCEVVGPIVYRFKDGSNQWWTAVQVRNHRYPIVKLEFLTEQGTFKSVNRTSYNYFVEEDGMGTGPFTFRVTDIYGHVLTDSGIVHIENGTIAGSSQFPPCAFP